MKYKLILPSLLAMAIMPLSSCRRGGGETEELLSELDRALSMRDTYDEYFVKRVDAVKNMFSSGRDDSQRYEINRSLAWEYGAYSLDSCVAYLSRNASLARKMDDPLKVAETDLLLAQEYAATGYHAEATDILNKYSPGDLPLTLRTSYFRSAHLLSSEMMAYSQNGDAKDEKIRQRTAYRDSLLGYVDRETTEWLELKREEAGDLGQKDKAREYSERMVEMSLYNSHDYAKACFWMSVDSPDEDEKIKWLAHSAIADVMCSTKDYASLMELSKILFRRGSIDRAFRYTADYCMPDAVSFNGKLRPWQIARFFPEIEEAYEAQSRSHDRRMMLMIATISALLLFLAVLLVVLVLRQRTLAKTRRKLENSYRELKESDNVKQEYIARFLVELSQNISDNKNYKAHVLKYLKRGAGKDLEKEIEEEPPIDEDISRFYNMFDETFISLYPSFVEQFNELLCEDGRITPKSEGALTPELRVFALIKLGITDSSKIAQLLHYSANTIYNYRAKTKNKALGDRDDFEAKVKAIQ